MTVADQSLLFKSWCVFHAGPNSVSLNISHTSASVRTAFYGRRRMGCHIRMPMYANEISSSSRRHFESYSGETKKMHLTLWQRIQLRIHGRTKIGEMRSGSRKGTPIYIGNCVIHGLYADTPLGGYTEMLVCRKCFRVKLVELFSECCSSAT
jgi:hypothetical protein